MWCDLGPNDGQNPLVPYSQGLAQSFTPETHAAHHNSERVGGSPVDEAVQYHLFLRWVFVREGECSRNTHGRIQEFWRHLAGYCGRCIPWV